MKKQVAGLNTETLIRVINDWEKFEADGVIGDCDLRRIAKIFMDAVGNSNVTFWMKDLAFCAYRELYERTSAQLAMTQIDLEEAKEQLTNYSWQLYPDRQGGSF